MSLHRNTIKLAKHEAAVRLVRLDRGGVDYLIDRDSRATLIGEGGPDWFGLTSDGRARLVKSGEARSVWRVECGSGVYFAKLFAGRGPWSRVRAILTGSPAEREWAVLQEAASRGGIAEKAFDFLDGPIIRVAAKDTPVPFSPPLEEAFLPQITDVVEAAKKLLAY